MTLEQLIQDAATRGELTHLSVAPSAKGYTATFTPSSVYGVTFKNHHDPVEALKAAIVETKVKRTRRVSERPATEET